MREGLRGLKVSDIITNAILNASKAGEMPVLVSMLFNISMMCGKKLSSPDEKTPNSKFWKTTSA